MKQKLLFFSFFIAVFLVTGSAKAQSYAFRILGSKGDVTVNGARLKIGGTINDGQTIKLGSGSYLGLAYKNGKTLELKTAGDYKVADLAAKVSGGDSGIASKYASFVYKELTAGDDQSKYQNRMGKTGSVERGDPQPIAQEMPKNTSFLDNKTKVTWKIDPDVAKFEEDDVEAYEIVIKDYYGTVLMKEEVDIEETSYEIDLNDARFKDAPGITCQIFAIGVEKGQSELFSIMKCPAAKAGKIQKDLESLKGEVGDSALGDLIVAKFYEKNNLILDAKTYYQSALKKSETPEFKLVFAKFIESHY